jgi:hypothetical protein
MPVRSRRTLVEAADHRDGVTPLFVLTGGDLTIVTAGLRPELAEGDITIGLTAASPGSGEARRASPP